MKKLLIALISALFLISCNKTGSYYWFSSMEGTIVYTNVDDASEPRREDVAIVTLSVENLMVTEHVADFRIDNFKLRGTDEAVTLTMEKVPYSVHHSTEPFDPLDGAWLFSIVQMTPFVDGVLDDNYTMRYFNGTYLDDTSRFSWQFKVDEVTYRAEFTSKRYIK